jgi:hypothetical protein
VIGRNRVFTGAHDFFKLSFFDQTMRAVDEGAMVPGFSQLPITCNRLE